MVVVEDLMTETLGVYVHDWFEPNFSHPFLGLKTVSVPDRVKPIPKHWVEDVQVQIEADMGDELDLLGDARTGTRTPHDGKAKLREALERLGLNETCVMHPRINTFDKNQLFQEKRRVKQELKRYDSDFRRQAGRLPTHAEKEPMRPLYVYYRRLKTLISQFEGARPGRQSANSDDEGMPNQLGVVRESRPSRDSEDARRSASGDLSRASGNVEDLEARICSLESEKSAVRAKLQAFQEKFVAENNRAIRYHKDILPIEREYRMYKNLKEKIAKVEAQLRDLQRGP